MSKYTHLRERIAIVKEKQKLRDEASREASIAHGHWELNPDVTTLKARDETYATFQRAIAEYDRALDRMHDAVSAEDLIELLEAQLLLVAPFVVPSQDTRPWCWRRPGNELCEGPFDTRKAAIHDARHGHAEEGLIEVGRCTPVLDAYPMIDAGVVCDMLNDNFCDMGLEGATAVVESVDEADEALRVWADKYLKVEGYEWVIADEEDVHPAFRKTSH